jgi:hypothetical protein
MMYQLMKQKSYEDSNDFESRVAHARLLEIVSFRLVIVATGAAALSALLIGGGIAYALIPVAVGMGILAVVAFIGWLICLGS